MAKKVLCLDPACVKFIVTEDAVNMEVSKTCDIKKQKEAQEVIQNLAAGKRLTIKYVEAED